jgi:hypothetical protein
MILMLHQLDFYLKTITFKSFEFYNFSASALEQFHLSKLRLYLGDNLWTYQSHKGLIQNKVCILQIVDHTIKELCLLVLI